MKNLRKIERDDLDAFLEKAGSLGSDWDILDQWVDEKSAQSARLFLRLIPDYLPIPEVCVTNDGEIDFDWFVTVDAIVSVTFTQNGGVAFAWTDKKKHGHGKDSLERPSKLLGILDNFYQERKIEWEEADDEERAKILARENLEGP